MVVQDEKVWVCGENACGNSFVELFVVWQRKVTHHLDREFISPLWIYLAIIFFLTRRSVAKKNNEEMKMENYFLLCSLGRTEKQAR